MFSRERLLSVLRIFELRNTDVLGLMILCRGGLSFALWDVQQPPWALYSLDASRGSPYPKLQNSKCIWKLPNALLGARLLPVENHQSF